MNLAEQLQTGTPEEPTKGVAPARKNSYAMPKAPSHKEVMDAKAFLGIKAKPRKIPEGFLRVMLEPYEHSSRAPVGQCNQ